MRCDSHVHVIGPIARYPQVATRTYLALPASLDALCRGAASSGIERFVIVQPSFYGTDNTVLLESLDVLGPRGRGVAVIDPAQTSKAMLDDCCARRMRPASQSLQPRQSEWRQDCPRLRGDRRLRASHEMACRGDRAPRRPGRSRRHPRERRGDGRHRSLRRLWALAPRQRRWTNPARPLGIASHLDEALGALPRLRRSPEHTAGSAWLAAILDRARERCVWGSDWPHTPGHDAQHGPDVAGVYRPLPYRTVVDDFICALGSETLLQRIMTDNPARLYGFGD